MRTGILLQVKDVPIHLPSDMRIEFTKIPFGGGSYLYPVRQVSVPQLPHEFPEGLGSLLLGLFQSNPSVFEIDAVHLFFGQALQETEVFYWNDSSQLLATP